MAWKEHRKVTKESLHPLQTTTIFQEQPMEVEASFA